MHRGNCGLQRIGADAARSERLLGQCLAFGDGRAIPARPILLFKAYELPGSHLACRPPRFVQQHQREQAGRFGLRQPVPEQSCQPNCLLRKLRVGCPLSG